MGDLIFVLPIFIIFFVILFQIFLLFKKGIDFIGKRFDLTIEQADEEEKINTGKMNPDYDQDEAKKRVAAAESKERILNQNSESEAEIEKAKRKNKEKIKRYNSKQRKKGNKNSSLGEIFAQYNEVEKAVIYNEILSKPRALKRDQN